MRFKSTIEYEEYEKEFAENEPDPMDEVVAQELERRAKKAQKEREDWEQRS
jgi:hypothetical protein